MLKDFQVKELDKFTSCSDFGNGPWPYYTLYFLFSSPFTFSDGYLLIHNYYHKKVTSSLKGLMHPFIFSINGRSYDLRFWGEILYNILILVLIVIDGSLIERNR